MNRRQTTIRYRDEFQEVVRGERRALQADIDTAGGFLLAGKMLDELLTAERGVSVMRQICRVIGPIEGDEAMAPTEETPMAVGTWTNELAGAADETTVRYGRRDFHPHPLSKRIKVSRRVLRNPSADAWIMDALADASIRAQEASFITGDGSGEPLGIINDSTVTTVTTAVSSSITGDDVMQWITGLNARFWARARVLTTPAFLEHILTLKDGEGNYLFLPYTGRLLNIPVVFSDALSSAVDSSGDLVAGEVGAIVGDFANYWIADFSEVQVWRLRELYAESNEIGFQVRRLVDGQCASGSAFRCLKIKT